MPISANFEQTLWKLSGYIERLENPDPLLLDLADELIIGIEQRASTDSGEMLEVATKIRGPFAVPGGRAIGVGDGSRIVDPKTDAPRGTIKDFLREYRSAHPKKEG